MNTLKKSRIRETPNLSTDVDRRTDTKKKYIQIFFFFRGFGLEGGGCCALCSRALVYIYPSNYTALLSHAVHFTAKFKHIYI